MATILFDELYLVTDFDNISCDRDNLEEENECSSIDLSIDSLTLNSGRNNKFKQDCETTSNYYFSLENITIQKGLEMEETRNIEAVDFNDIFSAKTYQLGGEGKEGKGQTEFPTEDTYTWSLNTSDEEGYSPEFSGSPVHTEQDKSDEVVLVDQMGCILKEDFS